MVTQLAPSLGSAGRTLLRRYCRLKATGLVEQVDESGMELYRTGSVVW